MQQSSKKSLEADTAGFVALFLNAHLLIMPQIFGSSNIQVIKEIWKYIETLKCVYFSNDFLWEQLIIVLVFFTVSCYLSPEYVM